MSANLLFDTVCYKSIAGCILEDFCKKSKIPVLFIHGKEDGLVPYEMSQRGYENAPEGSRILIVEGADHGMSYLIDKNKVISQVDSFVKENL